MAAMLEAHADGPPPAAVSADGNGLVFGVGLVVGLHGTGDAAVDHVFVDKSIVGLLRRAGLDLWSSQIEPGRIAKVMVSAELPAEPGKGSAPFPVTVVAIGDATNIAGGTLLPTPLSDQDGKVFAVGQGLLKAGGQTAVLNGHAQQPETRDRVAVSHATFIEDGRTQKPVVDPLRLVSVNPLVFLTGDVNPLSTDALTAGKRDAWDVTLP